MYRYRLDIEYDGTPFVGWQVQENGLSVQQAVETAIHAFSGSQVRIRAAGRTDAGVHARGQVVHVDLDREWEPDTVRDAVNAHLRPLPVSVLRVLLVGPDFDARFSASARHYCYRILNRRSQPALEQNRVWWVARPLDAAAMDRAAKCLLGHHDFTTFRATGCQAKSPFRTLDRFDVSREKDEIRLLVSARSFLHSQVRSMAGTLKLVGEGRWTDGDVAAALAARDRTACGPVAPACGLYLERVEY